MHMFGNVKEAKQMYAIRMSGIIRDGKPAYASQCVQCGECLEKCPQHIEIPDFLEQVAEELEDSDLENRVAEGKTMLNMDVQ
jgi:predicted aldo/keto reductase-like oxidoreductase